ncbi:hypothetical protein QYF36_008042 [Acer negundo]|nr:hypothetical protein QYF36_008042 [Acer negundo]
MIPSVKNLSCGSNAGNRKRRAREKSQADNFDSGKGSLGKRLNVKHGSSEGLGSKKSKTHSSFILFFGWPPQHRQPHEPHVATPLDGTGPTLSLHIAVSEYYSRFVYATTSYYTSVQ